MKQFLLGTPVGRMLMAGRDRLELVRSALSCSESVGTLANDQLATKLLTRLCDPQKIFVDVGAHIGSIISEVHRNDPSVKCIAVEAMPDKAARLRTKFPDVQVVECAAGETEGELSFFVNTKRSGYSSLGRPSDGNDPGIREIRVRVKRLDGFVPAKDVSVIKIDVEGAELGVLRGAIDTLVANRPTIMFESAPTRDDGLGYSKESLWQFLADREYVVLVPNRLAHNDPGLSQETFCESHLYPRRTTNYFAVARERRLAIRERARLILGVKE